MSQQVGGQVPHPSSSPESVTYDSTTSAPKQTSTAVSTPAPLRLSNGAAHNTTVESGKVTLPGTKTPLTAKNQDSAPIAQKAHEVISHTPPDQNPTPLANHSVTPHGSKPDAMQPEPEGISVALDLDFSNLGLDLPPDLFVTTPGATDAKPPAVHRDGKDVLLDMRDGGGTVNVKKFLQTANFERAQLYSNELVDHLYSPSTGMLVATLDGPITPKNIAAFKEIQNAYHQQNPNIPVKPLVVVVLSQTAWSQFKNDVAFIVSNQEPQTETEKPPETEHKKRKTETHKAPLTEVTHTSKREKIEKEDNRLPADFSEARVVKKIIAQFEKLAEEAAAARKESIKNDEIAKAKLTKIIESDERKLEDRNFENKKGYTRS